MISCTCAELIQWFLPFKCIFFVSFLLFDLPFGESVQHSEYMCSVLVYIFDSINLNLMTFVSNQTHTVTGIRQANQAGTKTVPFFSRLLMVFFSCLISRCYHFIIRPKNNKNKSLMLCFTLLSHRILNPCSVKPVAILFCCCWCCRCFISCAWAHTSFRAVCIGIRWIDVNQSQSHKVNIKNGKRKTMALEKINVLDILKWASTTTDTRACEMDRERSRS